MVAGLLALTALLSFAPELHAGDAVPAIPLVDQAGRAFSLDRLHGRAVVLSFVYTRCADSCTLVAAKLAKIARDSDPAQVAVVALTLDPVYDRPTTLWRYRAAFGGSPRWTLATGPPGPLGLLERRFGVDPEVRTSGRIDHADLVVVLDRQGRIARFVRGSDWTAQELAGLARATAGDPQDPLLAMKLWLGEVAARCGQATTSLTAGLAVLLVAALTLVVAVPLVTSVMRDRPG